MRLIIKESHDARIAKYSVLLYDRDKDGVDQLWVGRITVRIGQIRTVKGEDARTGPFYQKRDTEESSSRCGCLSDKNFLFHRGDRSWMLVHSRRPEVLDAIHRGTAFLTRMEGEWWISFGGG